MRRREARPSRVAALAALCAALPCPSALGEERASSREEAELLAQLGEARYRLAVFRARRRPARADAERQELLEAARLLDEARRLDGANLRATAFLGLARLEAARLSAAARGGAADSELAPAACEALADFFRLALAGTGEPGLVREVSARLDELAPAGSGGPVSEWWAAWRERAAAAAAPAPGGRLAAIVEKLRCALDARERERAAEELASGPRAGAGPQVIGALAAALREDVSAWVRAAAARSLGALAPEGGDILLAEALENDPSAHARAACAAALALWGKARASGPAACAPAAIAALAKALAQDAPLVAAEAARALGELGGAEGALARALESNSPLVREAASEALRAGAASDELAGAIEKLLSDARPAVRASAAGALAGRIRPRAAALARLTAMLSDPEGEVRFRAALAVANYLAPTEQASHARDDAGSAARTRLESLLGDPDPRVRLAAARHFYVVEGSGRARKELEALARSVAPLRMRPEDTGLVTVGDEAAKALELARDAGGPER